MAPSVNSVSATVVSVHAGAGDGLDKVSLPAICVELDGIVGDRHRSYERQAWSGDKQPAGTRRRNERQWSAVSVEELADISAEMELDGQLTAAELGANLCLSGVAQLSRLPKGTLLEFPSGAALVVEEYNPPCLDMGESLAEKYRTRSGDPLAPTAFSKAAKLRRGVVGSVEVPGDIKAGDTVKIEIYEPPAWLVRCAD
ncbi:MAG: MOSC domain-containing protein [Pseudomonadota bacterium]